MTIKNFSVVFNNDNKTFYAGQTVSGRVQFENDKARKHIKGIRIQIKGEAQVEWTESESYTNSDGKSEERTKTYSSSERYLHVKHNLIGNKCGRLELDIGEYSFPFSTELSANLPSSYKGTYGHITYCIIVDIDIPWGLNKVVKDEFFVANPIDLNMYPHLKSPAKDETSKTFCCLWCRSGPLSLLAYVPHKGFCSGIPIPLTLDVDNNTNVNVSKVTCELTRLIKWTARFPQDKKYSRVKLASWQFGSVLAGTSKVWNENLIVPTIPIPNVIHCSVIDIDYFIVVEADPEGAHLALKLEIPIMLGNTPLCNDAINFHPTFLIPATVRQGIDPSAPPPEDLFSSTFTYNTQPIASTTHM